MKKFQLFSEWRNVSVWGADLGDALKRRGSLQRANVYSDGVKNRDGEFVQVQDVLNLRDGGPGSTRGGKPYTHALIMGIDGQIWEVEAVVSEII